jgi:hypothetical protein
MPEKTVDAWVASAICSAFPDARTWDPTQAMKGRNWDRAFLPLEEGKVFILEVKGTTAVARTRKQPLQTHRIEVDAAQLDWYCDEVEETSMIPVYYVLPQPPWTGSSSSGPVPEQAACRVASHAGPFPQWAYVSRCTDLRRELSGRRSIDTDQLPLPAGMTLAEFFQDVRHGNAGRWLSPEDKDAPRSRPPARLGAEPRGIRQNLHTGSALAVFLPSTSPANEES